MRSASLLHLVNIVVASLLLHTPSTLVLAHDILSIHGSGTTNPSKCFWRIIDRIQYQTKVPTRITYRSVGSGTGMQEFIADGPLVDFASGDLPLPQDIYDKIVAKEEIVQLPVMLGAMSFFHNIPGTPHLNLTACLIAKMYRGEIQEWGDEEVLEINPNLQLPPGGLQVRPQHRTGSTSTTAAVTTYLAKACPSVWPEEDQGSSIEWSEFSKPCTGGSGGMVDCILGSEGTIGFLDAGFGHAAYLQEPFLTNRDGTSLNSEQARLLGGIESAAAAVDALPDSPGDLYPLAQFIDQPGEFSWPMVAISFVYVRKNLTYIENPEEQGLLKAFLNSLYLPEYMKQCEDDYEFVMVSGQALKLAKIGIDALITSPEVEKWMFETDTDAVIGTDRHVISLKRNSIADVERSSLVKELEVLERKYNLMGKELDAVLNEMDKLRFERSNNMVDGEFSSGKSLFSASSIFVLSCVTTTSIALFVSLVL